MEIDRGASCSVISEKDWQLVGAPRLTRFNSRLVTYADAPVNVKGVCEAEVKIEGQTQLLAVLVVGGSGPALCSKLAPQPQAELGGDPASARGSSRKSQQWTGRGIVGAGGITGACLAVLSITLQEEPDLGPQFTNSMTIFLFSFC